MMKLIKQRNSADCGICCLAMAARAPYSHAARAVGHNGLKKNRKPLGMIGRELVTASWRLTGSFWPLIYPIESMGNAAFRKRRGYRLHLLTQIELRELIHDRPAILSVDSLNIPGGMHFIYWERDEIFDPSRKKTYLDLPKVIDSVILVERRGRNRRARI